MALITGLSGFSFTLVLTSTLVGQSLDMGARGLALANAVVVEADNLFEPVNPAAEIGGGAGRATFSVGQAHALSELKYMSMALSHPVNDILLGMTVESFGFAAYRQLTASLVTSSEFADDLRVGIRTTVRRIAVTGYGAKAAVGVSAGWTMLITGNILAGGSWRYIGAPVDGGKHLLPQELSVGFEARASPGARILAAVVRESGTEMDLRVGLDARVVEYLSLRIGTGSNPDRVAFGLGLTIDKGAVDFGVSLHPTLGPSFMISILVG